MSNPIRTIKPRVISCEAEVERNGQLDACGAEAVAMRLTDLHGGAPWPACDRHASPARYVGNGKWVHP